MASGVSQEWGLIKQCELIYCIAAGLNLMTLLHIFREDPGVVIDCAVKIIDMQARGREAPHASRCRGHDLGSVAGTRQ